MWLWVIKNVLVIRWSCPCIQLSTTWWRNMGKWKYSSVICNICIKWRWVDGLQSKCECFWEEKFLAPLMHWTPKMCFKFRNYKDAKILPSVEPAFMESLPSCHASSIDSAKHVFQWLLVFWYDTPLSWKIFIYEP